MPILVGSGITHFFWDISVNHDLVFWGGVLTTMSYPIYQTASTLCTYMCLPHSGRSHYRLLWTSRSYWSCQGSGYEKKQSANGHRRQPKKKNHHDMIVGESPISVNRSLATSHPTLVVNASVTRTSLTNNCRPGAEIVRINGFQGAILSKPRSTNTVRCYALTGSGAVSRT